MSVRAEHRAWTRAHGADAHEAAAAAAVAGLGGGSIPASDKQHDAVGNGCAADGKGTQMGGAGHSRGQGQGTGGAITGAASAPAPGGPWVGGGSAGGDLVGTGGAMVIGGVGGGAPGGGGGMYPYAQQARDEWTAAYYNSQQQQVMFRGFGRGSTCWWGCDKAMLRNCLGVNRNVARLTRCDATGSVPAFNTTASRAGLTWRK